MELRLTYSGELLAATPRHTRAKHKHEIRRVFHKQLKRLWDVHPHLKEADLLDNETGSPIGVKLIDELKDNHFRNGYVFVPLVTEKLSMLCSIEILFLRATTPGGLIRSGDIDNRLKVLFDALRIPTTREELGGYDAPSNGEDPFFCLLEDDRLITRVAVETDVLLEEIDGKPISPNDAKLVISVHLKPYQLNWNNLNFG